MRIRLPSKAPPIAAALWVARHVSVFLPSCYTTWWDRTSIMIRKFKANLIRLHRCGVTSPSLGHPSKASDRVVEPPQKSLK